MQFVLLCSVSSNHGRRLPLDLVGEDPRRRAAAAAPGGRLATLHAIAQHHLAQPVGQVLRRQVHPGPVSDGHEHVALPAHRDQEGQGERTAVAASPPLQYLGRRSSHTPRSHMNRSSGGTRHSCASACSSPFER